VTGGNFYLQNDPVNHPGNTSFPAKVSDFRLDKYEVTVGRFRKFKAAWDGGWRPPAGAGKHAHLRGGKGVASWDGTALETGWDTTWASKVAPTDANLSCDSQGDTNTWTSSASTNESRPISCITWFEAYALCIWDGGFLPTEAERSYAAAGGDQQRVYPWSNPPSSTAIDCTYATFYPVVNCSITWTTDVGSESPKGDGRYGQADLGGNVGEWELDWRGSLSSKCDDCVGLDTTSLARSWQGGAFDMQADGLLVTTREESDPSARVSSTGVRCARGP
jgi:formylglycine-generating enzyme required for sulfatase activity